MPADATLKKPRLKKCRRCGLAVTGETLAGGHTERAILSVGGWDYPIDGDVTVTLQQDSSVALDINSENLSFAKLWRCNGMRNLGRSRTLAVS